jgi:hypothetical protein
MAHPQTSACALASCMALAPPPRHACVHIYAHIRGIHIYTYTPVTETDASATPDACLHLHTCVCTHAHMHAQSHEHQQHTHTRHSTPTPSAGTHVIHMSHVHMSLVACRPIQCRMSSRGREAREKGGTASAAGGQSKCTAGTSVERQLRAEWQNEHCRKDPNPLESRCPISSSPPRQEANHIHITRPPPAGTTRYYRQRQVILEHAHPPPSPPHPKPGVRRGCKNKSPRRV